jgi:hypothetical protein
MGGLRDGSRIRQDAIDAHGIRNVLQFLVAERLIAADQLVLDLLVDAARDVDPSGLGHVLQPCRDIDPIAVDIVRIDDDIAQIHPDTVPDPLLRRQRGVSSRHRLLDDDGTAHGLERAVEHGQEPVAGRLDHPAEMLLNGRLDHLAPMPLQAREGAFLVMVHEPAVSGDVSRKNGSQSARAADDM